MCHHVFPDGAPMAQWRKIRTASVLERPPNKPPPEARRKRERRRRLRRERDRRYRARRRAGEVVSAAKIDRWILDLWIHEGHLAAWDDHDPRKIAEAHQSYLYAKSRYET
jgi:hypothetical protein